MSRSLSQRIATRAIARQPTRSGRNRAVFLAIRDEVEKAMEDGWSVRMIWQTLVEEGKIDVSYNSFLSYVKRLIKTRPAHVPAAPAAAPRPPSTPTAPAPSEPPTTRNPPASGTGAGSHDTFTFNPTPRKEDLI